MKFKVGDRVKYTGNGPSDSPSDRGRIISLMGVMEGVSTWWIEWDNGERLYCIDTYLEHEATVEATVDAVGFHLRELGKALGYDIIKIPE